MSELNKQLGSYRWTICALVFFATTINYLDRQVISLLKPFLEGAGLFGSDPLHYESVYANIVICFQIAYASGMLVVGGIIDRFGTKIGYAISLFGWSLAAIGHAFARSPFGFGVARAALGVPEAGAYAEIFNSDSHYYNGSNTGNGVVVSEPTKWMNLPHSISLNLPPLGALILKL